MSPKARKMVKGLKERRDKKKKKKEREQQVFAVFSHGKVACCGVNHGEKYEKYCGAAHHQER